MACALFDCHDTALYRWRAAGSPALPLVHVDAHHDIEPARPEGEIDIGNFIRAGIAEGLVSRVYWVIPDPMWRDRSTRRRLRRELQAADAVMTCEGDAFDGYVAGVPLWCGPMAGLPSIDEPALLDVDVDYLFHTARHRRARPWPNLTPWQWPADLCRELDQRVRRRAAVTIATSLSGGFTPVAWQHLGREIAARLDGEPRVVPLEAFKRLEEGSGHIAAGDLARAESACNAAIAAAPADAAAYVHLAGLLHARGDVAVARRTFAQALAIDPSYRHPFRTRGFWFLRHDRLREAAAEFADGLALDPGDHHARLGAAMVAVRRRQAAEALQGAEEALGQAESAEAWRTLARAAVLTHDLRRARHAFTRAIRLTLQGEVPLNGPWSANPTRRLADPWHWQDHLEMARVIERDGDWATAMTHYRIAGLAAPRARRVRLRLAWTHLRRHEWTEAARWARPRWHDLPRWHFN